MKYKIRGTSGNDENEFDIIEVKIIKERARARITSWCVIVWLALILLTAAEAIVNRDRNDLHVLLTTITPFIGVAFGWYLGRKQDE